MSDKDQIALDAAREIYRINVQRPGIINKSRYVSLIQEEVTKAIDKAAAAARSERDSALDAETGAWGELERVRAILGELFLAFPPVQSKEQCDLMKRVSREIGGEK